MSDSLHCLYCANAKAFADKGLRCIVFNDQLAYSLCVRFKKAEGMDLQLKKLKREKLKYESNHKTAKWNLIGASILLAGGLALIVIFTNYLYENGWVSTYSISLPALALMSWGGVFGYYKYMKSKFNYHNTRYQNALNILTQYETK